MGACCETDRNKVSPGETKAEDRSTVLIGTSPRQDITVSATLTLPFRISTERRAGVSPASVRIPKKPLTVDAESGQQLRKSKSGEQKKYSLVLTPSRSLPTITPIHHTSHTISEGYTPLRQLQKRHLCGVYLMRKKHTQQQVIIKKIETQSQIVKEGAQAVIKQELEVLQDLDHPNVLKIEEVYFEKGAFYLVSEVLHGGEVVEDLINPGLSEKETATVLYQLLSTLKFCHSKGIFHLNIRLDNIVVLKSSEDISIKVMGFGSTPPTKSCSSRSVLYAAPELLHEETPSGKSDVWSCGVLFYQLLSGQLPFHTPSDVLLSSHNLFTQHSSAIPLQVVNLLSKMLESKEPMRASVSECMENPWIQGLIKKVKISTKRKRECLYRLNAFTPSNPLKLATIRFVSSFVISEEQVKSAIVAFKEFDTNKDGELSKEELIEAFATVMDRKTAAMKVERLLEVVDINHSGSINYSEFLVTLTDPKVLFTEENLELVFNTLQNDRHWIHLKDLQVHIRAQNEDISHQMWADFYSFSGFTGKSQLHFKDFVQVVSLIATGSRSESLA